MNTSIRTGIKPFSDKQRFPYGFQKSGDFSIAEAFTLATYGETLISLENGTLNPESEEETRFVRVIQGLEFAESRVEKVWMKYIGLARQRRKFFTVHSSSERTSSSNDDYIDDEELANY